MPWDTQNANWKACRKFLAKVKDLNHAQSSEAIIGRRSFFRRISFFLEHSTGNISCSFEKSAEVLPRSKMFLLEALGGLQNNLLIEKNYSQIFSSGHVERSFENQPGKFHDKKTRIFSLKDRKNIEFTSFAITIFLKKISWISRMQIEKHTVKIPPKSAIVTLKVIISFRTKNFFSNVLSSKTLLET